VLAAPTTTGQAADSVVVQPGDSLWGLAEQALQERQQAAPTDSQVAAAWPAWWSANREAVGDDPDLLLPGTVLQPPADEPSPDSP
jgi:nucleoid-associated protein YgaU